jgi:uncharacterized membrane protein
MDRLRSFKVFDIAAFDVVATLIVAVGLAFLVDMARPAEERDMGVFSFITLTTVVVVWVFLTGVVAHIVFQVPTKLGFYLRLNPDPRRVPTQ